MAYDSNELANLLAKHFIARRDVKAQQYSSGAYSPVTATSKADGERIPWRREDLVAHIEGHKSFGHYLVDQDNKAKLFAFDIDLTKWNERQLPRPEPTWLPIDEDGHTVDAEPKRVVPREAWRHPQAPPELRRFLAAQLRGTAEILAKATIELLDVPVAVSYSGGKGLHVYGLTGAAPAQDLRGAALEVVAYTQQFESLRGKNFFKHIDDDPRTGYGCIDLEVFPKQDDLDGKDLGNLLRLPLGRHGVTGDRAFFLTLSSYIDELVEADPFKALEGGDPWNM